MSCGCASARGSIITLLPEHSGCRLIFSIGTRAITVEEGVAEPGDVIKKTHRLWGTIMSAFEFGFTLFSLILGLSLAAVLNGLANVLKARTCRPGEEVKIRLGWLTLLVGILVAFDLITFWFAAWVVRDLVVITPHFLLISTALTGLYFVTASLVFPDIPEHWPDLDEWFDRHKAQIGAGIAAANLAFAAIHIAGGALRLSEIGPLQHVWVLLWLTLVITRRRWQSLTVLLALLGIAILMLAGF